MRRSSCAPRRTTSSPAASASGSSTSGPWSRPKATTKDNFNTVFDYEFTPESHFYLVFVRDRDRTRAAFSKIAYLFGVL